MLYCKELDSSILMQIGDLAHDLLPLVQAELDWIGNHQEALFQEVWVTVEASRSVAFDANVYITGIGLTHLVLRRQAEITRGFFPPIKRAEMDERNLEIMALPKTLSEDESQQFVNTVEAKMKEDEPDLYRLLQVMIGREEFPPEFILGMADVVYPMRFAIRNSGMWN